MSDRSRVCSTCKITWEDYFKPFENEDVKTDEQGRPILRLQCWAYVTERYGKPHDLVLTYGLADEYECDAKLNDDEMFCPPCFSKLQPKPALKVVCSRCDRKYQAMGFGLDQGWGCASDSDNERIRGSYGSFILDMQSAKWVNNSLKEGVICDPCIVSLAKASQLSPPKDFEGTREEWVGWMEKQIKQRLPNYDIQVLT